MVDSAANFLGNIDIISFGYFLPYNLLILVFFISGIVYFLVFFRDFNILNIKFSN